MALALLFLALVAMPAAKKFSVRRPEFVGDKIPTYPCQADDQMGWSYGEKNCELFSTP